jgi:hypothetical protein
MEDGRTLVDDGGKDMEDAALRVRCNACTHMNTKMSWCVKDRMRMKRETFLQRSKKFSFDERAEGTMRATCARFVEVMNT